MQNYFLLSTLTTKNFTLPPLRTTSLKRFMNNQKKNTSVRVQDNISISTRKRWTFVTVLSSWEVLNWTNERTIWKIISDDHRKKTCNKSPASFFVVAASAPHSVRFGWLSFILFQKSESSQQTNYFQINIDTHVLCVMLRWKWNTKKKREKMLHWQLIVSILFATQWHVHVLQLYHSLFDAVKLCHTFTLYVGGP